MKKFVKINGQTYTKEQFASALTVVIVEWKCICIIL